MGAVGLQAVIPTKPARNVSENLNVLTVMSPVMMPQATRKRDFPSGVIGCKVPADSRILVSARNIQKAPKALKAVKPKVLFFFASHIPAATWAMPPKKRPSGQTRPSLDLSTRPALNAFSTRVGSPKAARPRPAGVQVLSVTSTTAGLSLRAATSFLTL